MYCYDTHIYNHSSAIDSVGDHIIISKAKSSKVLSVLNGESTNGSI